MFNVLLTSELTLMKIVKDEGNWYCRECNYVSKKKSNVMSHVESVHLPTQEFSCRLCGKVCLTKNALSCHLRRHKKAEENFYHQ